MFSNKTIIMSILLMMSYYSIITAQGDPAGSNAFAQGGEFSLINNTNTQATANVNLITGQAQYFIELAKISCKSGFNIPFDLRYSGINAEAKLNSYNENVRPSWVGTLRF